MPDASNSKTLIVVGAAVLIAGAGAALYVYQQKQPVDEASLRQLDQSLLTTTLDLQEQLSTDIDARQLAEERERAESDTGLGLYTLCTTWGEFHANHPSEDSRANRDRACSDYRHYINTGEPPPERN